MLIVKKMPILQGFPTPDTVKFLSSTELKLSEFTPVFYDIMVAEEFRLR